MHLVDFPECVFTRKNLLMIWFFLISFASVSAETVSMVPCSTFKNDRERLQCYDNIAKMTSDIFIKFPPLVVNMVDGNTLKIEFVLSDVDRAITPVDISNKHPAIRNKLISLVSNLNARVLATRDGKIKLNEITASAFCDTLNRGYRCVNPLFTEIVWIPTD